jgi:hypothetical protein
LSLLYDDRFRIVRRRNANADSDGNRDTVTNANIYAVRNSNTQTYAVTKTSPDAATPPNTSNLLTVPETPPVLGNPISPTTIKPMRCHVKQSTSSMYVAGRFARNCLLGKKAALSQACNSCSRVIHDRRLLLSSVGDRGWM